MEIRWQYKSCAYSISIGRKTSWFEQAYFFSVHRAWYNGMKASYAEMLYHT